MDWLKRVGTKSNVTVWGWSILFGIILPLFTDKVHLIRRVWMVGLFLFLINMLFSVWLGRFMVKNNLKWWNLFIFPLLYLIVSYELMPKYTVYFALFYLGVTYLSWSMNKSKN